MSSCFLCVYLAAIKAQPRLLAMCEHFPQSDSEHPRVCSVGERSGLQTLWGAPATGQTGGSSHFKGVEDMFLTKVVRHPNV